MLPYSLEDHHVNLSLQQVVVRVLEVKKGDALLEFLRLIDEVRPEYFVFENVRGILSASLLHRPLAERGEGFQPLVDDEKPGSVLGYIIKKVHSIGYKLEYKLLNSADYGVPQTRERVFFIGSRDGHAIKLPEPTHGKDDENKAKWISFDSVLSNLGDLEHTYKPYFFNQRSFLR